MRNAFIQTILNCARQDPDIELITGDLGFGVLKPFWESLPDQFLDVGIAEQNMTSIAAGMALEGKTVFTYSIGNFSTLRCIEQIRNDCAYHNANVKIVCVGGGFVYGSLGMSHHATEDLAIMRALPNIHVFAPADAKEASEVAKAAIDIQGTCYIRLGRGGEPQIHREDYNFQVGKAIPAKLGTDIAIFCTGDIYEEVAKAVTILTQTGLNPTVYTFPTVSPLDAACIETCAKNHALIVTVEEHNLCGGFGSAVAEAMAPFPCCPPLLRLGIPNTYCSEVGDQKHLRRVYGLDGESIAQRILCQWKERSC